MGFRFPNLIYHYRTYASRLSPTTARNSPFPFLLPIDSHYDSLLSPNQNHSKTSRRWHVGHSHHDHAGKEADYVFRLGLAADIALATGKALTGYLSGSTAIIADAAHSVSDIVLSGVALWSFRVARAPKDKEHPYGHGKFETLGALGISGMLLATAGGIAWHAVDVLQGVLASPDILDHSLVHGHMHNHNNGGHHHGIDMDHPVLALNMTIISICVKEGLYWITKRAGEKVGSGLMKANAWHHRADAVSSVVALIGVGGAILGVQFLDPLAGLVVSGMILKAGVETGYQSVMELVDAAVPQHLLATIKQTILQVEGVKGCHRLRGRRAGSSLYLDVHIEVDPFSSVSVAHAIGEHVRHQIQKSHTEVAEVFIHIDPALSQCSPTISDQKNLNGAAFQISNIFPKQEDAEGIISSIFSSKFSEKMKVEHITRHLLQGKILLEVQVSMPPCMLIRDAMKVAKEVENEILKVAPNVNGVSIQLRLGHPIPQLHDLVEGNVTGSQNTE
ncbi:metal tolerance protein 2 isoform X2 [Magnolia sinica]|uniref:metal tolerance protein 2 isoform X2 n=1 Tax=Magnolia sinica TaxID=86752 RepID=UPI002658F899|nr:metal tolerance protein 2 isoform X2 [Magnolia sinica]